MDFKVQMFIVTTYLLKVPLDIYQKLGGGEQEINRKSYIWTMVPKL